MVVQTADLKKARRIAEGLLMRREHSTYELQQKLIKRGFAAALTAAYRVGSAVGHT
jgi:SOS response regulatory protein OraA/RecX